MNSTTLLLLAGLAGIGLGISLVVHIAAVAGATPFGDPTWPLHIGVFVLGAPTLLATRRYLNDYEQPGFWKSALRACPRWMLGLTVGLLLYSWIHATYYWFTLVFAEAESPGAPLHETLRVFSEAWMFFYAASMSMLYTLTRGPGTEGLRCCPRGHPIPPAARICQECGSLPAERSDQPPAN